MLITGKRKRGGRTWRKRSSGGSPHSSRMPHSDSAMSGRSIRSSKSLSTERGPLRRRMAMAAAISPDKLCGDCGSDAPLPDSASSSTPTLSFQQRPINNRSIVDSDAPIRQSTTHPPFYTV